MQIKGKVIVITGASQGIGLATAKLLAAKGAKTVLAARSADTLKKLVDELPDALAVPADLRKPDDIRKMIDAAMGQYGRIDILINNAGQGLYGPIESVDIERYRDILELNVVSVLRAMQLAIPIMRRQGGGMILNVSSRVSKNYFPNLGAYASTKYALNAISLTAREELKKDHIIVSVIHPKMTSTNFGKNAVRTGEFAHFRPGDRPNIPVDAPEQVAEKITGLIETEAAEAEM
ncbi:MAG: SDR family NAD(P)-dependent oxidoreductase [Patescibacteria group bacterium]|nr:SDR family NAD(P)-dependent oxidoreductase [Patescibacteria group bacterium]